MSIPFFIWLLVEAYETTHFEWVVTASIRDELMEVLSQTYKRDKSAGIKLAKEYIEEYLPVEL